MVKEAESRYVTEMNDLKAAIDAGQKTWRLAEPEHSVVISSLLTFMSVRSKP